MADLKILVISNGRFGLPSIQTLAYFRFLSAVAVSETNEEMLEDCAVVLKGMNIPVIKIGRKNLSKKLSDTIRKYGINTGLILTFNRKIPPEVYELPENGFFNVHPGPLPEYRGPHPLFEQVRKREKFLGITLHKLDADFDTGPVVMREMIRLDPADTFGIMNEKLALVAAKQVNTLCKMLAMEIKIPARDQDNSKAVYYQKCKSADITINWIMMSAEDIVALINACNPWNKGAVTRLGPKLIRLLEAQVSFSGFPDAAPGTILSLDENGLLIAAIDQKAILVKIIYADEGFLKADRLLQFGISAGDRFSPV